MRLLAFLSRAFGQAAVVRGLVDFLSERRRLALAVAGGLMLAAAFPKADLAGLAWLAPGVVLFAADGARSPFRVGYMAGLVCALASLHWLLYIPVPYYPIVGWVALSGYLALYPATWCWLCTHLAGGASSATEPASWVRRLAWALGCAAAWVGLEMLQARLLTGFPWNLLGVSQYRLAPLLQVASITGVYGLSFLVAWFSISLVLAAQSLLRQPTYRFAWLADLVLPLTAVMGLALFGLGRIASYPSTDRHLQVALVQPSIPQTMIWNDADSAARFQHVVTLSRAALATKPELLVWPEAATPGLVRYERDIYEAITNLVRTHGVWLILGADDAEPRGSDPPAHYNSSFLVNPQGEFVASYRKRRLVVFGEYIPLARWLPFMKWFTPIGGGFESGDRVVPFDLPSLGARTATLICFEDVFPHLVREYATPETDFLLNLTNDGWFRESAAHWQQAANAIFRAVENGLPLVRCANNGLTCWIDPSGVVHEVYFGDSKDIYGAGFKTARIPLRPGARARPSTFYHRYGDWFGWTCLAVSALWLVQRKLTQRRRQPACAATAASH